MRRVRIVPTVTLLVILFIFGSLSFWVVGRVKDEAQLFSQVALQRLARAGEINTYQAEGYARTLLLLTTESPRERSALRAAIEEFHHRNDGVIDEYAMALSTADSRQRLKELTEKRARYLQIRQQVLALSDQGKSDQALQLARTSLGLAYEQYTAAGDLLLNDDIAAARSHADRIRKVCTVTQYVAAFITVVGFLGGVLAPFLVMLFSSAYAKDPLHS
jgi:chemoreceptor-like protein with four helix bundle sensory module